MQQSPSPRVLILVASGPSTPARCAAPFDISSGGELAQMILEYERVLTL